MAFNPMDFFQAGTSIGQANASPFTYGANSLMDRFNAANDAAMKMALTAQMFKGEKNWEIQNMPQQQMAAAELKSQTGMDQGTSTPGQGAVMPGSVAGAGASGNPPQPSGGQMALKETKMLNKTYADPGFEAKVEQHKKLLESNVSLNQLSGILDNYAGNLKSAWLQQGGADPLHAAAGSALAWAKQPNTAYIRGIQNLKMEAQAAIARQMQGSSQGIQRMFAVTGHNIPDNWENPGAAGSMINDMLTNSYVMNEGVKRAGWTENQLLSASPEELQGALNSFKTAMPQEELQALREHLGTHFGNISPSQTSSLTGEANPLDTNPLIKGIMGENPNRQQIMGNQLKQASSSSGDINSERQKVMGLITSGKYDSNKLKVMFKQKTGQDL